MSKYFSDYPEVSNDDLKEATAYIKKKFLALHRNVRLNSCLRSLAEAHFSRERESIHSKP